MSLYLAESNVRKRLSLLHQPGLGLPLVSMDDQNRTIPVNTTQHQGLILDSFHLIVTSITTFICLYVFAVFRAIHLL